MPDLISLQASPLATTRQVAFQLRRDTSGIQNALKLLIYGIRQNDDSRRFQTFYGFIIDNIG